MSTASETILALEKALEAGPSAIQDAIAWLRSGEAMMGPRTEKSVAVILDAHASALRANAELLDQMHHFANADQRLWDEGQRDPESFKSWVRSRAAHLLAKFNKPAALDDNTKGAAE